MAESYPATLTLTGVAQTFEFEDGMQLVIASGTVTSEVVIIVDRATGEEIDGKSPFSDCYSIELVSGEPDSPLSCALALQIPTSGEVGSIGDLTLYRSPDVIPTPDPWCPVQDGVTSKLGSQLVAGSLRELQTFQLVTE